MLCFMHENVRRGYFQIADKPVSAEQAARMTGCSTDEATRLLRELTDSGVCSCTDSGLLFSRRMVRDERKRLLCAEAGKRGGNPTLIRGPKGGSKGDANPEPTPSSSSSTSTSVSEKGKGKGRARKIWWDESGWTGVTDADRARWASAYPACDIERQLAAMHDWLTANPTKRKQNYARFIGNWLANKQERGGDSFAGGSGTQPGAPSGLWPGKPAGGVARNGFGHNRETPAERRARQEADEYN